MKPNEVVRQSQIFENPELKDTKLFFDKLNQKRIHDNKNYSCEKACV